MADINSEELFIGPDFLFLCWGACDLHKKVWNQGQKVSFFIEHCRHVEEASLFSCILLPVVVEPVKTVNSHIDLTEKLHRGS